MSERKLCPVSESYQCRGSVCQWWVLREGMDGECAVPLAVEVGARQVMLLAELNEAINSFLKPPVDTKVPQTAEVEGVGRVVLTNDHETGPDQGHLNAEGRRLLKENLVHEVEVKRIALERLQAELREAERLVGMAPND